MIGDVINFVVLIVHNSAQLRTYTIYNSQVLGDFYTQIKSVSTIMAVYIRNNLTKLWDHLGKRKKLDLESTRGQNYFKDCLQPQNSKTH